MNQGFEPAKTVIVGSMGRMGKMLVQKASEAGLQVTGVDLPLAEEDLQTACKNAELVILCVPARNTAGVARKVAKYLRSEAILADITSVKERPLRQMNEAWNGPVVGTHPLFGPKNAPDADLAVALVPGHNATPANMQKVAAFFEAWGCRTFETTAEKHDQAMARIQNMNFITNLSYFAVLAGQKDLLPFLTPSFNRRKKAAAKMLTEDAEMFAGLFEANPHSHEAVRQFRKMLNLAAGGEIELLCKLAQWWWPEIKNNCKKDLTSLAE